eukprot:scaffold1025_cov381-Prasinococcus_capsulatus_cf.AAC.10
MIPGSRQRSHPARCPSTCSGCISWAATGSETVAAPQTPASRRKHPVAPGDADSLLTAGRVSPAVKVLLGARPDFVASPAAPRGRVFLLSSVSFSSVQTKPVHTGVEVDVALDSATACIRAPRPSAPVAQATPVLRLCMNQPPRAYAAAVICSADPSPGGFVPLLSAASRLNARQERARPAVDSAAHLAAALDTTPQG